MTCYVKYLPACNYSISHKDIMHKICVWMQIRKIKSKLIFYQSEWRIKDLRLIFLICVQTQILCNGAYVTHKKSGEKIIYKTYRRLTLEQYPIWEGTPHCITKWYFAPHFWVLSFEKAAKIFCPCFAAISLLPDSEGHQPKRNDKNSCGVTQKHK